MTFPSLFRSVFLGVAGVLLCAGGTLFVGCDGAGSKQASLYERLSNEGEGPWRIERLDVPLASGLGERDVQISFRRGDGRTYRMTERLSEDSTVVLASGTIDLFRGAKMQMAIGPERQGLVAWEYGFEASQAVFASDIGSRAFLRTLFPDMSWSQGLDVEMTLAPQDE